MSCCLVLAIGLLLALEAAISHQKLLYPNSAHVTTCDLTMHGLHATTRTTLSHIYLSTTLVVGF